MQNKIIINTVNGLCGSGKTFALTQSLNNKTSRTIIATPTVILADQYKDSLKTINNKSVVIHSKNTNNTISALRTELLNRTHDTVVMTQSAYQKLDQNLITDDIHLVYDEIPSVDHYYEPCIPYNHEILTRWIEVDTTFNHPTLYKIQLAPLYKLDKIKKSKLSLKTTIVHVVDEEEQNDLKKAAYKNARSAAIHFIKRNMDDVDSIIKPIIEHLVNEDIVLVDKDSYKKVIANDITNDKDVDMTWGNEYNKLYFLCLSAPRGFDKVHTATIMGANLYTSMMYKVWSEYFGVEFVENTSITSKLRYTDYSHGNRLSIKWLHDKDISKYEMNKIVAGKTIAEHDIAVAKQVFGIKPVLGVVNKDKEEIIPDEWTQCPVTSHGINKFDKFTAIYFGAALNRTPKHIKMLEDFGISAEYIRRATAHEVMHQCVMRTALRDPNSTEIVEAIVADKAMAEELARLFPGCMLGAVHGVQRQTKLTYTEKNRRKSKLEILQQTAEVNGLMNKKLVPDIHCNFYADIFSTTGTIEHFKPHEFATTMESWSKSNLLHSKKDNFVMNNVVYKSSDTRKKDDALYTTTVILDIDDGDLSHDEFHRIFSEVQPYSHFVTNSAGAREGHDKYRAFFFVKGVLTPESYTCVFNHLIDVLDKNGYKTAPLTNKEEYYTRELERNIDAKFTGIDMSKSNLSSIFYAPCTIIGYEDYQFFYKFGLKDVFQIRKYAIDYNTIVTHTIIEEPLQPIEYSISKEVTELKPDDFKQTQRYTDVINLVNQLRPGNRTVESLVIAGKIKNWHTDIKQDIFQQVIGKGIDKYTIKTFKIFANL